MLIINLLLLTTITAMPFELTHHHHHDPFAGSGCTCSTFCDNKCAINASAPSNTTFYRMSPKGVLDLSNKDTGDIHGDTSFVLSRRTIAYQCRKDPSSFFCQGLTQFAGDDSNSTDVIIEFQIELDGNWGPYLYCNPIDVKQPTGKWSCDVSLGPATVTPPPQCKSLNYSLYPKAKWRGFGAKNTSATNIGQCCALANARKAGGSWTWYNTTQQCETYSFAFGNTDCDDCSLGYVDPSPPPCNCSRVHKTVGREVLNETFKGYPAGDPAGGIWYSHPEQGECKDGHYVGDGSGCTWRVVKTTKIIRAACMYHNIDANVEQSDAACFGKCPVPKNVTGDCYLKCYNDATDKMTKNSLSAPWGQAFQSNDKTKGGCPPWGTEEVDVLQQ